MVLFSKSLYLLPLAFAACLCAPGWPDQRPSLPLERVALSQESTQFDLTVPDGLMCDVYLHMSVESQYNVSLVSFPDFDEYHHNGDHNDILRIPALIPVPYRLTVNVPSNYHSASFKAYTNCYDNNTRLLSLGSPYLEVHADNTMMLRLEEANNVVKIKVRPQDSDSKAEPEGKKHHRRHEADPDGKPKPHDKDSHKHEEHDRHHDRADARMHLCETLCPSRDYANCTCVAIPAAKSHHGKTSFIFGAHMGTWIIYIDGKVAKSDYRVKAYSYSNEAPHADHHGKVYLFVGIPMLLGLVFIFLGTATLCIGVLRRRLWQRSECKGLYTKIPSDEKDGCIITVMPSGEVYTAQDLGVN